jgi:hypothetical protein
MYKVEDITRALRPQKEVHGSTPFISPLSCALPLPVYSIFASSCPIILFTQVLVVIIFNGGRHFELVNIGHKKLEGNTTIDSVGGRKCHHLQRPWDLLLWPPYHCWCLYACTLEKWSAFLWYLSVSVCLCTQGANERCLQSLGTNSTYQNKKKCQYLYVSGNI